MKLADDAASPAWPRGMDTDADCCGSEASPNACESVSTYATPSPHSHKRSACRAALSGGCRLLSRQPCLLAWHSLCICTSVHRRLCIHSRTSGLGTMLLHRVIHAVRLLSYLCPASPSGINIRHVARQARGRFAGWQRCAAVLSYGAGSRLKPQSLCCASLHICVTTTGHCAAHLFTSA